MGVTIATKISTFIRLIKVVSLGCADFESNKLLIRDIIEYCLLPSMSVLKKPKEMNEEKYRKELQVVSNLMWSIIKRFDWMGWFEMYFS